MVPRRMLAMAAIMASAATGSVAQTASGVIPFTPTQPGGLPAGFQPARTGKGAPAAWRVIANPNAPGELLEQTSTDQTDYRFPLAIYDGASAADVDVTVRFKAMAGRVDRAGGIAVRLADPDNYYVVRANALEDNVNFYRVVQGSRREIKGMGVKVSPNAWHTLGLRATGDRFTISFDGAELFSVSDQSIRSAGKVALWTKADSVTRFGALSIEKLP
jgi:hypothetical protein